MAKYRAVIKQTGWFEVEFEADEKEPPSVLAFKAAEAFDTDDPEAVDYDICVRDVEKVED